MEKDEIGFDKGQTVIVIHGELEGVTGLSIC